MPKVRFFQNGAGQRLAYVDEGRGPLVVLPPWWVSHLERDAEAPAYGRFFARLASRFRVVRFDRVGVGLSDRARTDYAPESELTDLEALVDHLEAPRFHLFGCSCAGPVALAYAALHPERVDRIVLYASYAHGAAISPPDVQRALVGLVRAHWGLGSRTLADLFYPGDADGQARFKALQKASADAETAARLLELTFAHDARAIAPRVQAPVLVVHRRKDRAIAYEHGRALAATLPNATLVTLDGAAHMPWDGDGDAIADAVLAFLGGAPEAEAARGAELAREGEVWRVRFAGREARVGDAKGIADLARLLARPGDEAHVFELLGVAGERRDAGRVDATSDRKALARYKARLAQLADAIDDATAQNDAGTRARLASEREALLARVAADTGLGGRARAMNDPVERARKAVTARIRDAIKRIAAVHAPLGEHLGGAIVTGVRCAYRPREAVRWIVSPAPPGAI